MKTKNEKKARAAPWVVAGVVLALAAVALGSQILMAKNSAGSVVQDPGEDSLPFGLDLPLLQAQEDEAGAGVDWVYWRDINPSIVCWVSVLGTTIDYAVVQAQSSNPTFYLSHDIYGSYNQHGCPYVDADCSGIAGISTVIFGHNMGGTDVTMFADFAKFSDRDFAADHRSILLQTPSGDLELQVSAVDVIRGSDPLKVTDFESVDDMRSWYAERYSECAIQLENDTQATQLFTFVTCSYNTYSNERTVVYAQPINTLDEERGSVV